MNRNDVLINPYWTDPTERKKGFAKAIIQTMVMDAETKWNRCYAIVKNDNAASIHCLEKAGFQHIGYAAKKKWSYHLTSIKDDLLIYCYQR